MREASFLVFALLAAAGWTAPAVAQAAPPIRESWFVGEPLRGALAPATHFAVGPSLPGSIQITIASSRLYPNVLVELAGIATGMRERRTESYAAGLQLYQLANRRDPTFCTLTPYRRGRHHCLVDTDRDGLLDAAMSVRSRRDVIPLLVFDDHAREEMTRLDAPVAIRSVPRESAAGERTINLVYIGRRQMSRRDATFMLYAEDGRRFATGPNLSLYLDELPPEAVIAGVRLANLVRRDKIIEFDVATTLPRGPFEPRDAGQ